MPKILCEEVSAAALVDDETLVLAVAVAGAVVDAEVVSAELADAIVEEAATVEGDQQERVEVVETQGSVPL